MIDAATSNPKFGKDSFRSKLKVSEVERLRPKDFG